MVPKIFCLLILLAIPCDMKPLKQAKVVKAVNCGMKEGSIKGEGDIKFDGDQDLVSGSSVDVDYHSDANAGSADIKFAIDKEIYMYERHTYSEMTYSLPVRTGKHTLILKFAEMYFENPGQRVFNIKIGKKVVVENMDVIQKTGSKYAAHEEYIEFEVKNAGVYINDEKIPNALKQGKIQVGFVKGKADNPIIQAIIVYQGPVEQTTKQDYEKIKKNWGSHQELIKAKKENEKMKELISMTKKQERIVIRNDQLLIEKQEKNEGAESVADKFGKVRTFLMSPIGILIWAAIFSYKFYIIYTRFFKLGAPSKREENEKEN